MFSKLLAKGGIGSAKIDTVVENMTLYQGETVRGVAHIQGGKVDQEINGISIALLTKAKGVRVVDDEEEEYYTTHVLGQMTICGVEQVRAGESYQVPFSFRLPSETPITSIAQGRNESYVWVGTELDIDSGLDSGDHDYLTIMPHPAVAMMINKFLQNGFEFTKVDVEVGYLNSSTFSSTSGIYQEIEMRPRAFGGFHWKNRTIQEIELSFIVDENAVHLLVEVDRSYSGDGYVSVSYPITACEDEIDQYFQRVFPA